MLCLLVRLEMPRKKRNFGRKTRARRSSAPAIHFRTNNRPSKRICWTDEGMVAAVKNGMLVKRAAGRRLLQPPIFVNLWCPLTLARKEMGASIQEAS